MMDLVKIEARVDYLELVCQQRMTLDDRILNLPSLISLTS